MWDWWYVGLVGCVTGGIYDWFDVGLVGCGTGEEIVYKFKITRWEMH
jgi:hypothetical protein